MAKRWAAPAVTPDALEDRYALNENASRAAVFNGWREMNDYMTQNKIDVVAPQVPKKLHAKDGTAGKHATLDGKPEGKPESKGDTAGLKAGPPLPNPLLSLVASPVPKAPPDQHLPGHAGEPAAQGGKTAGATAQGAALAGALPPGFPGAPTASAGR